MQIRALFVFNRLGLITLGLAGAGMAQAEVPSCAAQKCTYTPGRADYPGDADSGFSPDCRCNGFATRADAEAKKSELISLGFDGCYTADSNDAPPSNVAVLCDGYNFGP